MKNIHNGLLLQKNENETHLQRFSSAYPDSTCQSERNELSVRLFEF